MLVLFGIVAEAQATTECRASTGEGFVSNGFKYVLSSERMQPGDNAAEKIRSEFGPNAALADWLDLKRLLASRESAIDFFNGVGIRSQPRNNDCDNYFVSVGGASSDADGRHFFVARHDGVVPENWSVLDDLGNHLLDLGRWNYASQAIVKVTASSTPEVPPTRSDPANKSPHRATDNTAGSTVIAIPSSNAAGSPTSDHKEAPSAAPEIVVKEPPPPSREGSLGSRVDFPFYQGVINGTIVSLTGQDTSNAEMVGGINEKDIEAACNKSTIAWSSEAECIRGLMVLTKRSTEPADTYYDDLAIKDRGFTFTKANADCGERKLTIWRKDKSPQDYIASVDDKYYWHDKAANRPIHDFFDDGPIGSENVDYLTNLYALLCPATVTDRLYGANIAPVDLGRKSRPFKIRCIPGGYESIRTQGSKTVNHVQMVNIKGHTYPRMKSTSVEGKSKTDLGEQVSPFANARDYVYYAAYCSKPKQASKTEQQDPGEGSAQSQEGSQQVYSIQGRWVPELRFCAFKTGEMADAKQMAHDITIKGNKYDAYAEEQTCTIRASKRDHDGMSVTLSLACKGQGERYNQITKMDFVTPDKVLFGEETWFKCSQRSKPKAIQFASEARAGADTSSPNLKSSTAALLARWRKLNDECRGGTRQSSCDPRNSVGDQLEKRGCKYLAGPRDSYTCK